MAPSDFYRNRVENVWLGECKVKGLDIIVLMCKGLLRSENRPGTCLPVTLP